jgi:hypothetical protein
MRSDRSGRDSSAESHKIGESGSVGAPIGSWEKLKS